MCMLRGGYMYGLVRLGWLRRRVPGGEEDCTLFIFRFPLVFVFNIEVLVGSV